MENKNAQTSLHIPDSFEDADVDWLDEMTIQCLGIRLRLTRRFNIQPSTDQVISLFKHPSFVRSYVDHLDGFQVDNMVEVGIWDGGSAIFFWNLLKPRRLCCIELKKKADQLSNYIEREQLSDRFRVHFETDQSDSERLQHIMADEYGDEALDLVIDDASHLYTPSRATFQTLFPRLRSGGLYFLEDWKINLIWPRHGAESDDFRPFHQLVHELLDVSMRAPEVISAVKCYHNFVVLERGPADIEPESFDVGSYTGEG